MSYIDIFIETITITWEFLTDKETIQLLKTCKSLNIKKNMYNMKSAYPYYVIRNLPNKNKIKSCTIRTSLEYKYYLNDKNKISEIYFDWLNYDIPTLKEDLQSIHTRESKNICKLNIPNSVKEIDFNIFGHEIIKFPLTLEVYESTQVTDEQIKIMQNYIKKLVIRNLYGGSILTFSGVFSNLIELHLIQWGKYSIEEAQFPQLKIISIYNHACINLSNMCTANNITLIINNDACKSIELPLFIKTLIIRTHSNEINLSNILNLEIRAVPFTKQTFISPNYLLNTVSCDDHFNSPITFRTKELYLGSYYQCDLKLWDGLEILQFHSNYGGKIINVPKTLKKVYIIKNYDKNRMEVKIKNRNRDLLNKYIEYCEVRPGHIIYKLKETFRETYYENIENKLYCL